MVATKPYICLLSNGGVKIPGTISIEERWKVFGVTSVAAEGVIYAENT
jgi:hypothetical protein